MNSISVWRDDATLRQMESLRALNPQLDREPVCVVRQAEIIPEQPSPLELLQVVLLGEVTHRLGVQSGELLRRRVHTIFSVDVDVKIRLSHLAEVRDPAQYRLDCGSEIQDHHGYLVVGFHLRAEHDQWRSRQHLNSPADPNRMTASSLPDP